MILPDLLDAAGKAARFQRICDRAMTERRGRDGGIGTLAEKWQHQIVKRYLTENTDEHEVGVEGRRFVSDVRVGDHIYEVQTGEFTPMAEKLAYYLEHTACEVTVVHPIAKNRWVSRINPATSEISPRKRSPRHGKAADLLPKLYPIRHLLHDPRLQFRILLLEVHDFRLENEKSRRAAPRFERIPLALLEDVTVNGRKDLQKLIPELPEDSFTVKQFSALTKLKGRDAYSAVKVLVAAGLVEQTEKIGRSMGFRKL